MKITRLLFICSVLLTIACEDSAKELEILDHKNAEFELNERSQIIIPHSNQDNQLQKKLQWVSYISAQVIMTKMTNRVELSNYIQGRESVTLNELIGESSNLNFKSEFLNILRDHIDNSPPNRDPIHGTQTPPKPLITCEDDLGDCLTPVGSNLTQRAMQFFLNSVLNENCIELYFPEVLHPLAPVHLPHSITSTAHPLNYNDVNFGFHHSSVISEESDNNGVTEVDRVNHNYLDNFTDNVIVARPYTNLSNCRYEEYLLLNFSGFLQR
ncbi:hypothetical protein [uncultured Tenacibaculum sp.]|uniref:hypothetical protein n=1 Tax=uncultured Tenacibaculum sp. TaxID=174713 RepID=UPI00262CF0C0|nr:hypothetical protein [uncultured Tenacibaculum sp.]